MRRVIGLLVLLAAPLLASPIALNLVNVGILKPDSVPATAGEAALDLARAAAWGPFVARVANAEASLAAQRGDSAAQLTLLTEAASEAAWDPALAARLAELRLAGGDREGAIRAWRTNHLLLKLPLNRGLAVGAVSPAMALDWFGIAQAVDPSDPRPYAETARVLLAQANPDQAAQFMAQALRLGGREPGTAVLARRLVDPFAPLDPPSLAPSPAELGLLAQTSQVLTARGDYLGAIYADQFGLLADPSNPSLRADLATLRQRYGRS